MITVFFFFFQAEDGIRDYKVTGVQTCALPICGLDLRVVDSTAPDAVRKAIDGFDLQKTLFLVSSKSGSTTEVSSFYRHFRGELDKGKDAGSHFVAITDPGSPLEELARKEGFLRIWSNPADIGGPLT